MIQKKNVSLYQMKELKDILSELRNTLSQQGIETFHVLEELVPVEEQMAYFRYFEQLRRENKPFVRDEEVATLFSPETSIDAKKRSLSLLASVPDVAAYRCIETYHENPLEPELKNWSAMALLGSRIVLASDLSGEQQIYISSGLGGHDKRLRFFSLFTTANREDFTDFQREIIEREFRFQLQQADVEIEKFDINNNYFTILMLFSFDFDIRATLDNAVMECNQYGNFLDSRFLFTNVKVLSETEIEALLKRKIE